MDTKYGEFRFTADGSAILSTETSSDSLAANVIPEVGGVRTSLFQFSDFLLLCRVSFKKINPQTSECDA
jgi:hypothetical protein